MARMIVLILLAICFMSMVTGLSLQLHLLSHEHSHEHDFNDCSTCRQLLVSPEKLATGPQIILPNKELCKESIEFIPQFSVTTFHYKSINARPPPFIFSI